MMTKEELESNILEFLSQLISEEMSAEELSAIQQRIRLIRTLAE